MELINDDKVPMALYRYTIIRQLKIGLIKFSWANRVFPYARAVLYVR